MLPTPKKRSRSAPPRAPKKQKVVRKGAITSGSVMVKSVPRGIPNGCPREMRVKLKYFTELIMAAPAVGVATYNTFRANGPFDPLVAVGGNQPRYYDQWSNIYTSVTTVSSKCSVRFANEQYDTSLRNVLVGVIHSAGTTPITGTATLTKLDALEYPKDKCQFKYASGNNAVMANLTWKPEQYFIGKTIYDEDLASLTNTTPVRDCYFHVWTAQDISNIGALPNRTYQVEIEYDLLFFDPIVPTQS